MRLKIGQKFLGSDICDQAVSIDGDAKQKKYISMDDGKVFRRS